MMKVTALDLKSASHVFWLHPVRQRSAWTTASEDLASSVEQGTSKRDGVRFWGNRET